MKKIIYSLVAIVLLFTSCSKKRNDGENLKKTDDIVEFSFYSSDITEPISFDNKIAKEITKRTGVKLNMMFPNLHYSQFIKLMIANKTYPDLIFAKSDITKLIEEDAVIPLDALIDEYGDNIKKLYGDQLSKLRYTLEDPQIYTVGTYDIRSTVLETSGNLQIQNEVLKEFFYPEIKTLDDYENLLKAYIKKYPEINGEPTIGFSIVVDDWYWYLSLSNPGNYVIGYPDDGQWIVNQDTIEATYKFLHPEIYQYYKWLNKLYYDGLLDPESFTQSKEMWETKLESGRVLGTSFAYWGLQDIQTSLCTADMANRTYAYLPITASEKYKDPSLKDYGFSGGWGIAISKDCKDPVKAFKFLDWMCSEEAQILNNWGIEGEHYFYDGTGKRVGLKDSVCAIDGLGKWRYPFPQGGNGYIDSTGNPLSKDTRETITKNYNEAERETLKAYGAELWIDLFPTPQELGVSKHGQIWQYPLDKDCSNIVAEADDYVKNELIKIILDSPDNFEKNWLNMQNYLINLGLIDVGKKVTQLIQMKMELWK